MKREIHQKLLDWKNSRDRKPLVLKGARQTGKTFSLKEFGQIEFRRMHYINFQKDKTACDIFTGNLSPRKILESMQLYLETTIEKTQDIIFFDEIQDCPRALTRVN
ncbi:MAG: AAA family ATPase [Candidatus Aminicenantes bacterium]|nr:AAA family ATPase [Candidatus Aminicenantes bacterium]